MSVRLRWGAALFAALVVSSCSKCGAPPAAKVEGVERVLPKGAVGVVIAPSLTTLGEKVKLVQSLKVTSFAGQLQGFGDGKALFDALVGQLGIDVRDAAALEKAGLDGARPAGAAMLISGHLYLALPVKDEAKFAATLDTLAAQRLGASLKGELVSGDAKVKTFHVKDGQPPRLAWVMSHGFALVSDGGGSTKLGALSTMGESDSLSSDKAYADARTRVPADGDLLAWLPLGSPALLKAPLASAIASVSLRPAGLSVLVSGTSKPPAPNQAAFDLSALQPQGEAKDLLGYLPRDAFLVARYTGDPSKLTPLVKDVLGPYLNKAFDEGGFDLDRQGLSQVQPGVVASLSLSERPPMDKGMPSLDLRQTNPFTYVHLSGAAAAKSEDVVLPALEKVITLAPRFGANMELRTRADGQKAVVTTYAQGEGVHFAPKGPLVFFASPIQRLDALVKSDGQGGSPVTPLGDEALAVAIDLSRLSSSVRALPESAWGLGGFAIKATTLRWLDATDDLKGISASVGVKDQRVEARLELKLAAAP
ncbi:MAG: hypothetical protein U0228_04425 [Myxococcaceae bacterium]